MSKIKEKEKNAEGEKVVSITKAAEINKVTRQAIYVAIKLGKLKAKKEATRWTIHVDDLKEYTSNKYNRKKSMWKGKLLFDNEKGYYSVNQVAEMLKVPAQKIYYATRTGLLKASRKGAAWVIRVSDIEAYKKDYLSKKKSKGRKVV